MQKQIRTSNKDARQYVQARKPFQASNMFADWYGERYVVYSYASHFPMYIYETLTDSWYGNKDKFSRTTTRHQSQARPTHAPDAIHWLTTEGMHQIERDGTLGLFKTPVE